MSGPKVDIAEVRNEFISCNICKTITVRDLEFEPEQSHYDEVYTKKDRALLLDYLEKIPKQSGYTYGIRLMFCFDCRIGELKSLKWSDYLPDKYDYPVMYFRH